MSHLIVYFLFLLLRLLHLIFGRGFAIWIGKLLGKLIKNLSKKRYNITVDNLKHAFPEKSDSEIFDIAEKSYENLGISFSEIVMMDMIPKDKFQNILKIENMELIHKNNDKGNGLIMMSAHFGNWEFGAFTCGMYPDLPLNIVVKKQSNPYINKKLNEIRQSANNIIFTSDNAAKEYIKLLSKKKAVAMITDQSAPKDKSIYLEFFGRSAPTYDAPARLALKYRSPIILGLVYRHEDYTYTLVLEEIKYDDLENNQENIIILSKRILKRLEDRIRERPDLWVWQHNRWKHAK